MEPERRQWETLLSKREESEKEWIRKFGEAKTEIDNLRKLLSDTERLACDEAAVNVKLKRRIEDLEAKS